MPEPLQYQSGPTEAEIQRQRQRASRTARLAVLWTIVLSTVVVLVLLVLFMLAIYYSGRDTYAPTSR